MVTDTIGDLLTRIRNAQQRRIKEVVLPSSKILLSISEILKKEQFILDYQEEKDPLHEIRKILKITLRYQDEEGVIRGLKRISKPGARIYVGYRDIPKVLNGIGIVIISTPKGVMTGEEAKAAQAGGEMLCKVW